MINWDDFDKIWARTSPLTPYQFSDSNYEQGWNFVGSTPPARQMWDYLQKQNDEKFKYLRDNFGTPNMVTSSSQMTDTEKVYVYLGSEAGWNSGHWYYYDEGTSSWADGGVYNSVAFVTDTTLSIAGQPADAKATGDALNKATQATETAINELASTVPIVDPTLTISGAAADAEATGTRIRTSAQVLTSYYLNASDFENGSIDAHGADSSFNANYRIRNKTPFCFTEDVHIYSPYYIYAVNMDTDTVINGNWSLKYLDVPKNTRFRMVFTASPWGGTEGGEMTPATSVPNLKVSSDYRNNNREDAAVYGYVTNKFPASFFENGSIGSHGEDSPVNSSYRIRTKELFCFPTNMVLYSTNLYFYVVDAVNGSALSLVYKNNIVSIPANTTFRISVSFNKDGGTTGTTITAAEAASAFNIANGIVGKNVKTLTADNFGRGNINGNIPDSAFHEASRILTDNFYRSDYDIAITAKTSISTARVLVYTYSNDGTYTSSGWVTSVKIPAGTNFRCILTLNPNTDVSATTDEILAGFNIKSAAFFSIDSDAENLIMQAQRHFVDSGTGTDTTGLTTFAHLTDIHVDATRFDNFLNFVRNNSVITKGIVSGDIVNTATNASEFAYIAGTTNELMYCVGNHDRSGITHDAVKGYLMPDRSNTYYYQDFNDIRVIVLDQCDQSDPDGTSGLLGVYTQAQIDWFIGLLQDALTNSKHVLIVMHDPEQTPVINDMGFCQRYYRLSSVGKEYITIAGGTIIGDIINAFKNSASISKSYNNQSSGTITVNTSFSGNGVFIGYVCGHYHADLLGYSPTYADQLNLNCCLGALANSSANDLARFEGQHSENCFNVYVIDTAKRQIKIVRVGADHNDLLQERKQLVLNY